MIHPPPPAKCPERLYDAVKRNDKAEQEAKNNCRDLGIRSHCRNSLCECRVIDWEEDAKEQVCEPSTLARKSDGPKPAQEVYSRPKDIPREFG